MSANLMSARVSILRLVALAAFATSLAACGPKTPKADTPAIVEDPAAAAAKAQAEADAKKLADAKVAFDAAAGDAEKLHMLEDTLNPWALHRRATERMASQEPGLQQLAYQDMEDAAQAGVPEALMWVGERYAEGKDGYPLKPNTGIIMVTKAAEQGHPQSMYVLGNLYAQAGYMHDMDKAREWFTKAKAAGWKDAEAALAKMDASKGPETEERTEQSVQQEH